MKQQTKRPPKPSPAQPVTQHPPATSQAHHGGLKLPAQSTTGKENALDATNRQVKFTKEDGAPRFKSYGANKLRPQTACQQQNPNPISPVEDGNQRAHLHSTMHNPAALSQLRVSDSKVDRLEATQPQILKSKYSSTRQQQELLSSQGGAHMITGKRVVQPKLVVQPDAQEHSERISNRWSPSQAKMLERPHKRNKAKKSKSQTIQAQSSHNLRSTARANPKRRGIMDFLDANLNNNTICGEVDEKDMTLKILNSSADLAASKKGQASSSDRCKVQMKYLNFHRKNVTQRSKPSKRSSTTVRYHAGSTLTQQHDLGGKDAVKSTSEDRIRRVTESLSPPRSSKTGASSKVKSLMSKTTAPQVLSKKNQIKSAVDIPQGISTIRLDQAALNPNAESELSLAHKSKHNNSALSGTLQQQSNLQLSKKRQPSISPERVKKINKIIRENIKKELQAHMERRREQREREASSLRRKTILEQKNQQIRKLNNEKIQKRRLKMKENLTIRGDDRNPQNTTLLEEALLAASDGVQNRGRSANRATHPLRFKPQETEQSHGCTQGMDFKEVRKEILNELRQRERTSKLSTKKLVAGHGDTAWIDQTLNLKTSKSQKQDFLPLRNHMASLSLNQQDTETAKKPVHLSQIKNENMLVKREKIRKFMKDKARALQAKHCKEKSETLNVFKKVRCNLSRLNEFVQSKLNPLSGTSGITTPALKVRRHKKNPMAGEGMDHKKSQHERNITPSRVGLFEQSDVSLNRSQKPHAASILGQQTQKELQKLHDTLYEDSRLSSLDPNEERSNKRDLKASVCFEKSASQKNLRKDVRPSNSPQLHARTSVPGQKARPQSALSLQTSKKRKMSKSQVKKMKPLGKQKRFILPSQGKITSMRNDEQPDYAASVNISESDMDLQDRNENITMNLKFSDQAAASIIQKEVRKYLGHLGFYEARMTGQSSARLQSPGSEQIDIFIERRVSSRKSTPGERRKSTSDKKRRQSSPSYEQVDQSRVSSVQLIMSPEDFRGLQQRHFGGSFEASEGKKRPLEQANKMPPRVQTKDKLVPTLIGIPQSQKVQSPPHVAPAADFQSQSSSLFDRHSFQNFSRQKLTALMQNNEYQKLIQFREECLVYRENKEKRHIQKLYSENQLTPRGYKHRKEQIERWVTLQRADIEQTKQGFRQEWEKTIQMIEETQKNVDFNKEKIGIPCESQSFSQASSRSRQKPKQFLVEEAPRSYRSGGNNIHTVKISDLDPSQDVMTSRDSQKIDEQINSKLERGNKVSVSENQSEVKPKQSPAAFDLLPTLMSKMESQHQPSNSGDYDEGPQPTQAFISKLEKVAMSLNKSAEQSLSIDDQLLPADEDPFKSKEDPTNRVIQIGDINKYFSEEQKSASSHKSEPLFQPDAPLEGKISDMLDKNEELRTSLNYHSADTKPKENNTLVPVVPKRSEESTVDRVTDQILNLLLEECVHVPKRAKLKTTGPPMPEHDVYSVDQCSLEREERREWVEIRQRHLIEANLIRVDQYVNELVDLLLQYEIPELLSEDSEFDYEVQPDDNLHIQFLKLLTQPIQRPPAEALELMQKSELGSYQHFETTLDMNKYPIVSREVYREVERLRERHVRPHHLVADSRKKQIIESIPIQNKCIFDAVNESLMKFRPYGIVGQPMPWSNKVRRLQTKVEIASVDTERLFQMVKQEIFRWSQVFCGSLPGPIFHFPNPRTGVDEFSEETLQEVRERRLTQVLTQDTVEHEHHWLNFEFEEAQIKVDLADIILETLVSEVVVLLDSQAAQ